MAKKTAYILSAEQDHDFADLLRRHAELRFDLLPRDERRAIEKADFVLVLVSADLLGALTAQGGAWTKLDQLIARANAGRLITVLVRHVMLDGVPFIPVVRGAPLCLWPPPLGSIEGVDGSIRFTGTAVTDHDDRDALCADIVRGMVAASASLSA